MNKMPSDQTHNPDDTLEAEYSFDYKKGKPNRFAAKIARQSLKVVVLDEDVAEVFTTPESVNNVLRALIKSMPQTSNKPPSAMVK